MELGMPHSPISIALRMHLLCSSSGSSNGEGRAAVVNRARAAAGGPLLRGDVTYFSITENRSLNGHSTPKQRGAFSPCSSEPPAVAAVLYAAAAHREVLAG